MLAAKAQEQQDSFSSASSGLQCKQPEKLIVLRFTIICRVSLQDLQWKWALHLLEAPLGSNAETDSAVRNAAATLLCSSSCWAVASNLLNEAVMGTQQRIFQRDDIEACALLLTECEQNELGAMSQLMGHTERRISQRIEGVSMTGCKKFKTAYG
eukprot:s35_g48.t1